MAISFTCPTCGRKLKAPDNAAGKSSKCPGCGSPVTCPELVVEAELIPDTPQGPDPFSDLDADEPYGMAPEPVTASAAEARRPCPMCGEMIVATAAKCRFCGEVFDPAKKKGGPGAKKGKLRQVASHHRSIQVCVLLILACWIGMVVITVAVGRNTAPAMILVRMSVVAIAFGAGLGLAIYAFLLARQLYSTGLAILLAIVMLVPCMNVVIALFVSQRASQLLRDNGYEVGLLGARTS
jgi:predicted RNA-binding Zn-ribbon protein involved in translation (DUF1610 family)